MRTVAGLFIVCALAYGQNAAPALTFEVASVKPAPPPDGRGRTVRATGIPGSPFKDPGRFTAENFSLANLITVAYDIPHYRLSAPGDLNMVMFNIEAKMPVDTTKAQFQIMLQNLLAERFGLKVHWQAQQMDMYQLVVAKNGPKLKEAVPDPPSNGDEAPPRPTGPPPGPPKRGTDGFPIPPPGNQRWMAIMNGKAVMRGHNETAAEMASAFSNQVGHPVTDGTGLKGKYDYTVYWSASAGRAMAAPPPTADGGIRPADDADGPSLFAALQEQLGLKLEAKKGQVQVLIVDHVEKTPTEN